MGEAIPNNGKEPPITVAETQPSVVANDLPPDEAKDEIASPPEISLSGVEQQKILNHIGNLSDNAKTAVVTAAAQQLPDQARRAVAGSLQPSAPAADLIWKVIVFAFAISFGISILGLIGIVFLFVFHTVEQANIQVLLIIVTTVGGILAGFISGRASAGDTSA
jgi:hypothetical protein